ncbi:unnamed protein product [Prunus brigantina]
MIGQRGIEANPEKIKAILDMTIPKTIKDIPQPSWAELKEYMSRAPLLSTPEPGDTLMIYLSVSATAVSSVLIQTKEGAEHPVHYVSKALQDAKARYPDIEKLAFALVVSARRLRPYFQAHTIHVLTNQPLRQVLQKPETSGRLVKWAIELGEFDIHYKPRPATKGQAVADFISEFTEPHAMTGPQITADPTPTPGQIHIASNGTLDLTQPLWTLYVDGSSNARGMWRRPCPHLSGQGSPGMGAEQIRIFGDSQPCCPPGQPGLHRQGRFYDGLPPTCPPSAYNFRCLPHKPGAALREQPR